jgi:cytochrome c
MEFLQQSVLPQSAQHIVLLKYMLVLAYMILIPYFSLLTGSIFFSRSIAKKVVKDSEPGNIAYKIIEFLTFNKLVPIALGFVPMFSVVFIYLQLLQLSELNLLPYFAFSFLFLLIGIVFVYFYKHYYGLNLLLAKSNNSVNNNSKESEILAKFSRLSGSYDKYGKYSFWFLSAGIYVFLSVSNFVNNFSSQELNLINVLFSLKTIVGFIQFLILSFLFSYVVAGYNLFKSGLMERNYEFIESLFKRGLILSLILPLVILVDSLMTSTSALSENYFFYTLACLFVILLISVTFYRGLKFNQMNKFTSLIFLGVIFISVFIIRNQYMFETSTQLQVNKLVENYALYENKIKAEFGLNAVVVSGADIFNGKCIACHNFDKKVVGPAYKDVLPKYEGKMADLVKFVLNPVKVNPDFPSMPNQGLKPNEAEAIADYIMKTYTEQYK